MKKNYAISCARCIAMCLIIICHIMQRDKFVTIINGASIQWAFWFNVGVQMFLFISGLLYGKKEKIEPIVFYKKVFPKILIDYYIFIGIMLVVIHFSPLMKIDNKDIISLLTFSKTIGGLGHLWFIPTILFCYLLTPIFSNILNSFKKDNDLTFYIKTLILFIIIHIVVKSFFLYFKPAWINCYYLGMVYSHIEKRNKKLLEGE